MGGAPRGKRGLHLTARAERDNPEPEERAGGRLAAVRGQIAASQSRRQRLSPQNVNLHALVRQFSLSAPRRLAGADRKAGIIRISPQFWGLCNWRRSLVLARHRLTLRRPREQLPVFVLPTNPREGHALCHSKLSDDDRVGIQLALPIDNSRRASGTNNARNLT
jgi:hypothetical protein